MSPFPKPLPPVVQDFLCLVGTLNSKDHKAAEAAFRAALKTDPDAREELLFYADGKFAVEKRRFIQFNNRLVRRAFNGRRPRKTLLLLPFCVQERRCPHHVAWRIENCRRCGRCPIGPIREVCDHYGIKVRLTLRSRFAPEFVREASPDLVLAVACEHELVAGILRIAPCDCYGIMNSRPEGFCKNTKIQVKEVERVARAFLGKPRTAPRKAGARVSSVCKGGRRGASGK